MPLLLERRACQGESSSLAPEKIILPKGRFRPWCRKDASTPSSHGIM